jgi:hypothetical protein
VQVIIEISADDAAKLLISALNANGHDCSEASIYMDDDGGGPYVKITAVVDLPIKEE